MTFSIVGQYDATQLAVSSKMEASISGEHQETSHVSPANLLLEVEKREPIRLSVNKELIGRELRAMSCEHDQEYSGRVNMVFEGPQRTNLKTKATNCQEIFF